MSRRLFQPSEQQRREVMALSGYGIAQHEIASMLDIDPKTLRRAFRRELDTGAIKANAAVAQALFTMATRDKVPSAAIFWLKCRAGWREAHDVNIGGQDDKPMAVHFTWARAHEPPALPAVAAPIIEAAVQDDAADAEGPPIVIWADGTRAG
jgi:hypothetical protein